MTILFEANQTMYLQLLYKGSKEKSPFLIIDFSMKLSIVQLLRNIRRDMVSEYCTLLLPLYKVTHTSVITTV